MGNFERVVSKINKGQDVTWDEMWNALNDKMFNLFADGKITEEESESVLDKAQQMGTTQLSQVLKEVGKDMNKLTYNKKMEAACLKAYDDGDRTTLRQVIEELRASLSKK